jgi:hypothetical protein
VQPLSDDIQLNLMLAEYAQLHGGKLFIVGGGLFAVFAVGPNAVQQLAVCGTITLPFQELNREHIITITLVDMDEHPVMVTTPMGEQPFKIEGKLNATLPPLLPRGTSLPMPFAVLFSLPIQPGSFYFRAVIDSNERSLLRLPFTVLAAPPGMVPGAQ